MKVAGEKNDVDWWRIGKFSAIFAISCVTGYLFEPLITKNKDAINTVVTIFSILAGFLIAVITLITEPTLKQAQSWQQLQLMKATIRRRLFRQRLLFYFYLLTLGVALTTFLVPDTCTEVQKLLGGIFLGLATFVFLSSFALPGSLMRIQMERYEAELEEKKPDGIKNLNDIDASDISKREKRDQ